MEKEMSYVGVDVAKAHLDVRHGAMARRFPNTAHGHRRLVRWLKSLEKKVQIICEPSGGYEKRFVAALWALQIPVSLVNARQVRDFARARGRLAKTDELDAEILERYGEAMKPRQSEPLSENQRKLAELVTRRQQLLESLQQEKNRVAHLENRQLISDSKIFQKQIRLHIEQIEKLLRENLDRDNDLSKKVETLKQVDGVGETTAHMLVAQMPELGKLSRRQVASLIGVAPFNRDSGTHRGKPCIQGGRFLIRKTLYMAALAASRSNPVLKPYYQRLLAKGKPAKMVLVALMRKLIIHLNGLLKQPQFQPI